MIEKNKEDFLTVHFKLRFHLFRVQVCYFLNSNKIKVKIANHLSLFFLLPRGTTQSAGLCD